MTPSLNDCLRNIHGEIDLLVTSRLTDAERELIYKIEDLVDDALYGWESTVGDDGRLAYNTQR